MRQRDQPDSMRQEICHLPFSRAGGRPPIERWQMLRVHVAEDLANTYLRRRDQTDGHLDRMGVEYDI
jgi:hypothetical protein